MRARRQSLKEIVQLWDELFAKHRILTFASAITIQALIATVSFVLLGLGILGATGDKALWNRTIGPAIRGRVLPDVYRGLNAVVQHVFATSSTALIVFATLLSIWKISNVVRGVSDALNVILGTKEERSWKVRLPLSFGDLNRVHPRHARRDRARHGRTRAGRVGVAGRGLPLDRRGRADHVRVRRPRARRAGRSSGRSGGRAQARSSR